MFDVLYLLVFFLTIFSYFLKVWYHSYYYKLRYSDTGFVLKYLFDPRYLDRAFMICLPFFFSGNNGDVERIMVLKRKIRLALLILYVGVITMGIFQSYNLVNLG